MSIYFTLLYLQTFFTKKAIFKPKQKQGYDVRSKTTRLEESTSVSHTPWNCN